MLVCTWHDGRGLEDDDSLAFSDAGLLQVGLWDFVPETFRIQLADRRPYK